MIDEIISLLLIAILIARVMEEEFNSNYVLHIFLQTLLHLLYVPKMSSLLNSIARCFKKSWLQNLYVIYLLPIIYLYFLVRCKSFRR